MGVGASLSGLAAGVVVDHAGYSPAFLTCGAAAGVALIVLILAMPETRYWTGAGSARRTGKVPVDLY